MKCFHIFCPGHQSQSLILNAINLLLYFVIALNIGTSTSNQNIQEWTQIAASSISICQQIKRVDFLAPYIEFKTLLNAEEEFYISCKTNIKWIIYFIINISSFIIILHHSRLNQVGNILWNLEPLRVCEIKQKNHILF